MPSFHLRNKCLPKSRSLIAGKIQGKRLGELEKISENPRRSRGFSPAREFSQTLPRLSPGYECTENIICFLYKLIIFLFNKDKARMYTLISVMKVGDSQPHCHVIFVLHSATKTHL